MFNPFEALLRTKVRSKSFLHVRPSSSDPGHWSSSTLASYGQPSRRDRGA